MTNPPGHHALKLAHRWFDPATAHSTFEPLVADWQREWYDATVTRRYQVLGKGWLAFLTAVIVSFPRIAMTSTPPAVINRIVSRIAIVTVVISLILLGLALRTWMPGDMIVYGLPGLLVLALPFSLVSAVDAIRCFEALPPHVERAIAAKLALVATLLVFAIGGWVVPDANGVMRRGMVPQGFEVSSRGVREATTYDLIFEPSSVTAIENARIDHATIVRRELIIRASMVILPTLFIWLRWGALDRPRRRWSPLSPGLATLTAMIGVVALWFVGLAIEIERILPYSIGMWTPVVGVIGTGLIARWISRHR